MRFSLAKILVAVIGLIATLGGVASADTKLDVDAGWGLMPRSGRWTPVFVTASDPKTRNVDLFIEWPVGNYSMRVQQAMTIDATARTFPILLPVHGWTYQQAQFTLRDRESHKTLARFPKDPESSPQLFNTNYSDPAAAVVGLSGTRTALSSFQMATTTTNQDPGFLPSQRLPPIALGYDSLDILILNAPNLVHSNFGSPALQDEQQLAIIDWVRAGGKLILWPGDGGFPATGPLADILPAMVLAAETIELSEADLFAIGLPARFKSLPVHRLEPKSGAEKLAMFNAGQVSAYAADFGLGRIVLAPLNIADLQLDDPIKCRDLWRPLLKEIIELPPDTAPDTQPTPNYNYGGNGDSQGANASMRIADFLGDIQGAGQIGFSYIAYVLFGLMLVVGPVDWFVLKKLGRQPWTWVTTSGWIVLVTTGALYAGYIFKSGDLHYRTLSTIDQVGNMTVASTGYVSLYSSRTRTYEIKTGSDGWWQPGAISEYGGSGFKNDIDFHQTNEGNIPQDMPVSVWSLRFLRGDHISAEPAMISADLRRLSNTKNIPPRIVGTITNLTDHPLKHIRIEVREGVIDLGTDSEAASTTHANTQIPPHGKLQIDESPAAAAEVSNPEDMPNRRYGYYQANPATQADLWKAAAELNYRRGKQMAGRVAAGRSAIVYAETVDPAPAAELAGPKAIEKHYQFIRALVELHEGREK